MAGLIEGVVVTPLGRFTVHGSCVGCDVISEKPMTVDEEKCQEILDAIKRTGRRLRVTFNYRYAPHNTKIRELVMDGAIGDVHSVHFEWLLVHKSTYHFDLVNFWLGMQPKTVFAFGGLMFYGRENAEKRGVTQFYQRAYGSEAAKEDPFALHLEQKENLKGLYLDAEHEDGYQRDQSVFGDGISIEDTLGVLVQYRNKAVMTYSLNAYMPWEGFNVHMNGSKGRIEVRIVERSYVNAGGRKEDEGALKSKSITVHPMFAPPYEVEIEEGAGGHGGGDPVLSLIHVKYISGPRTIKSRA